MNVFGLFFNVGILWFLITLFTRSTDSSQSLIHTWIVVIGMGIVSVLTGLLMPDAVGLLRPVINIAALYLLVDKVCETNRKTTIRICAWYFGITFLLALASALISD